MRIAFVAPWFRSLSHLYGDLLARAGHDVLVVTTDRSFEAPALLCREHLVDGAAAGLDLTRAVLRARRALRQHRPDVVFEDVANDPRWLALTAGQRRVVMVHDPAPHDAAHVVRGLRQRTRSAQRSRAHALVCFSQYARGVLQPTTGIPVHAVPLLSEMADAARRPGPQAERRGFCVVGRTSAYKGIDVALRAWTALDEQVRRGEPLDLYLSGDQAELRSVLDAAERTGSELRLHSGTFSFAEVSEALARSRAVLLPYRSGSQSGVQVLALQHGVVPLVSAVGALPEYQPAERPALPDLDPLRWAGAMTELTRGDAAATAGSSARARYEHLTDPVTVVGAWVRAAEQACAA